MNPSVQPLKHGVGFRLIPAPSSSMIQQLSPSNTLRQKMLCKNKTIQPSTSGRGSRGKRGHALKFHNFVANDCHSNGSVVNSDQPTFCLREEHGTKQITVSHWKTSQDGQSQEFAEEPDDVPQGKSLGKRKNTRLSDEEKQESILESLLATKMLHQTRESESDISTQPKKKRSKRKPLYVRRVIHDSDEDTKINDNEIDGNGGRVQNAATKITGEVQVEPLDLSNKEMKFEEESVHGNFTDGRSLFSARQGVKLQSRSYNFLTSPTRINGRRPSPNEFRSTRDPIEHLIQAVGESAARAASIMASISSDQSSVSNVRQLSNYGNNNSMYDHGLGNTSAQSASQGSSFKGQSCIDPRMSAESITDQERLLQKQSTQRNVIKQKLEDAFKTNGFLVKTKQVSDGEATFCKFRQLRKYTRYYLKSWHKHLPDEVNKLYKGFLPPNSSKTNNSSNQSE